MDEAEDEDGISPAALDPFWRSLQTKAFVLNLQLHV